MTANTFILISWPIFFGLAAAVIIMIFSDEENYFWYLSGLAGVWAFCVNMYAYVLQSAQIPLIDLRITIPLTVHAILAWVFLSWKATREWVIYGFMFTVVSGWELAKVIAARLWKPLVPLEKRLDEMIEGRRRKRERLKREPRTPKQPKTTAEKEALIASLKGRPEPKKKTPPKRSEDFF